MSIIKITGVESKNELTLTEAQTFSINGKNRILIYDYSQLRMEPLGGKLSPLTIEGYFTLIGETKPTTSTDKTLGGITSYHALEDYFDNSRRSTALTDQFIVRVVTTPEDKITPGANMNGFPVSSLNANTVTSQNILVFRGTLRDLVFDFDTKQTLLINYRIVFNVYPYPNLTKKIKESYFLK